MMGIFVSLPSSTVIFNVRQIPLNSQDIRCFYLYAVCIIRCNFSSSSIAQRGDVEKRREKFLLPEVFIYFRHSVSFYYTRGLASFLFVFVGEERRLSAKLIKTFLKLSATPLYAGENAQFGGCTVQQIR